MKQVKKQEIKVAKEFQGRRIPLSGAGKEKWDVKSDKFIIDCKQTEKKSINIPIKLLEKISRDALTQGKTPLLHLFFKNSTFPEWIILPYEFFKNLLDKNE